MMTALDFRSTNVITAPRCFYLGSYQLQDVQIHYGSWDSPDAALKGARPESSSFFRGVQRNHLDVFFLSLGSEVASKTLERLKMR